MNLKSLLLCALSVSMACADVKASSLNELLSLAGKDALPEVRQAAGLALSTVLVEAGWTLDRLQVLTLQGESAEVRSAAARALGTLRVRSASAQDADLIDIVRTAESPEESQTAAQALAQRWLEQPPSLEALTHWAVDGDPAELRSAAVPALGHALFDSAQSDAQLLDEASTGGGTQFQAAAAQALIQRLQGATLYALTAGDLFQLASGSAINLAGSITGLNPQLRAAAAAALQRRWQDAASNLQSLERIASDPTASAELRTAAGAVLSQQLLEADLPLEQLDAMADGPTEQVRAAAVDALVLAWVGAVGQLKLSLGQLIDSIGQAPSLESGIARAKAAFVLVRAALATLDGQAALETIINGRSAIVSGYVFNGALQAVRQGAIQYLTGIYTFFGFIDRFQDPLQQLMQIAGDPSLTPEFRTAASHALTVVFQADRAHGLDVLAQWADLLQTLLQQLAQADLASASSTLDALKTTLAAERPGLITTAEVAGDFTASQLLNETFNRALAAIESALRGGGLVGAGNEIALLQRQLQALAGSIQRAPDVTLESLEQMAGQGPTPEVRQAASVALAQRLLGAGLTVEALIELTVQGQSPQVQQAAVPALAAAWAASSEVLYGQALQGSTPALRSAAAQALLDALQGNVSDDAMRSLANGETISTGVLVLDGAQPALQQAAAWALVSRFSDPETFTVEALFEAAAGAPTPALQEAAAQALAFRLIGSNASQADLFALIAEHTMLFGSRPGASIALSGALARALADRLCKGVTLTSGTTPFPLS